MAISSEILRLIQNELDTDRVQDDVTTRCLETGPVRSQAWVKSREIGVFSGEAILEGFQQVFGKQVEFELLKKEGAVLKPGDSLVSVRTSASMILSLERTLLNFLALSCGVASLTRQFVEETATTGTKILATRKTLPGLKDVTLAAVRAGGGWVHRRNLSDGILIKDNHLAFASEAEILNRARIIRSPLHRIEIEVQNLDQLKRVLNQPHLPDIIMLDNLPLETMKQALLLIDRRCEVEVSGGIQLNQVREIARLGVNYISVGRITHSVPSLDLTLDTNPEST